MMIFLPGLIHSIGEVKHIAPLSCMTNAFHTSTFGMDIPLLGRALNIAFMLGFLTRSHRIYIIR